MRRGRFSVESRRALRFSSKIAFTMDERVARRLNLSRKLLLNVAGFMTVPVMPSKDAWKTSR